MDRHPESPDLDRFTLGTYASYADVSKPDGELCAAVLDERTGHVYPFGRWDAAQRGIAEMRANPDGHFYAHVLAPRDGFTPAEPGVDRAIAETRRQGAGGEQEPRDV